MTSFAFNPFTSTLDLVPAAGPVAPADSVEFVMVAATNLSGQRLVSPRASDDRVEYADPSDPSFLHRPVWMTTAAALAGDQVTVMAFGRITEPGWSWTPQEPIYLGAAGTPTQVPPVAPDFLIEVATAETPTTISYDPKIPLVLA